jgi:hypothetical protein
MIEQFVSDIIDKITDEIKKEKNKKRIDDELIYPIMNAVTKKIYPWITLLFAMYTLILVLVIVILLIIMYKKTNSY